MCYVTNVLCKCNKLIIRCNSSLLSWEKSSIFFFFFNFFEICITDEFGFQVILL